MSEQATEMEVRVAKAICLEQDDGRGGDRYWPAYIETARAAIRAMREPTEAMENAYYAVDPIMDDEPRNCPPFVPLWSALIDAATAPSKESPATATASNLESPLPP